MEEARGVGCVIRYYCTAGNGMESFLIEEVKKKLAAENVCQIPGKVLFSSPANISRVSGLKAAERLFLLLKQDSPLRLSSHTSPAKAASMLESKLLADRDQWTRTAMTWSRLQWELAANRNAVKTPNAAQGVKKESEEGNGKEEQRQKRLVESKIDRCTPRDEERGNKRLRSDEHNGIQTPVKIIKTDEDGENTGEVEPPETDRRRDEEAAMALEFSSCRRNETNLVCSRSISDKSTQEMDSVDSSSRGVDVMEEDKASENVENISFRINCKCNGSLSRCLSAQDASKVMGAGVRKLLGWKVDLRNPLLEIHVYLSDDYYLLGIPLNRLPLANRSYIKTTGLRATVAWAMSSLVEMQPGCCVVDPMCGVGTILIEAAQEHEAACFLGIDTDDGQLQRASDNIAYAGLGDRIHLLKASSMALPLPTACVDAVICDLPFGRKFSTTTNMAANLPLILSEMERVLRFGGTLVVLLSPQLSCLLKKLLIQKHSGSTPNQESKFQSGIQNCPPSEYSTEQETFQIHPGVGCSRTRQTELQHSLLPPLSSLKHQTTLRVSLGAIDGLIHKYVKTDV